MENDSSSLADLYRNVCKQRSITPDLRVADDLERRSSTLFLTAEPHITLVLHLLTTTSASKNSLPTTISITASHLPAATVGTLATYLSHQKHLTGLSISNTSLPDTAVETLLTALTISAATTSPLSYLCLSDVGLTTANALVVAPLLSAPLGALTHLDLSNNAANFRGVRALTEAVKLRPTDAPPLSLNISGNLVDIEMLNTLTHGVGAVFALFAGIWLTLQMYWHGHSAVKTTSIAVFCISLFTLLASSCAYHALFRYPRAHALLRRADHCSIFLLIAGSYTPFLVIYTLHPPTVYGPITLAAVWTCAAAGMVRSLLGLGTNRTRALFALGTGWIGIFSVRTLKQRMQRGAMYGVFLGGMVYSIGLIFYLMGKRIPILHVVWHIAVIVAGGLHYLTLSKYVVHTI